ncbi:MAG: AAA family ATPase [Patescibacteria group bacterium]|nr:AAA family ATPase [Patescibacteria group bacterium]MDD5294490.1 AAA family ATPase [Patescibacteria group bacterium]MDD5554332.1 AAA family ATPase [Patescibacteria group bacterium]
MIISISGTSGSGKSTVAKKLAKKLNWPRYYMGGMRRELAKKRGLTLAEYNKLGEKDPVTDLEVDKYQKKLGQTKDNFIIEGRTSWHFIPHSLKIYLEVDEKVSARRIFKELKGKHSRNEDKNLETIADVLKSQRIRKESDKKRYKKYYQIDVYDKKNYDFILDTTGLNKKQVFDKIYDFVKSQLNIDKK